MGGKALKLKGFNPKRISTLEKEEITKYVQTQLLNAGLDIFSWLKPVKNYHQKPNHGDIDLIGHINPKKSKKPLYWHKECIKALSPKAFHWNPPVLSLEVNGCQVDITGRSSPEKSKTNLDFCHYSPLGNILGRMIRKTGAKWGIDGLQYPIHEKNDPSSPLLKNLDLTDDMEQILKFCGLDYHIWKKGFETQEDIFNFACQSPFFDKRIFLMENLNHTHRKRDQTRPDYHQWLEFIKNKPDNTQWTILKNNSKTESKTESKTDSKTDRITQCSKEIQEEKDQFLKVIDRSFPTSHVIHNIEIERTKSEDFKKLKKDKFDGSLVKIWTTLENQELGDTIKKFKQDQKIEDLNEFKHWLETHSKDECKKIFLDFYARLKENNIY